MATGLRTWAAGMVVAALVAGGCSWSSEEPGLFRTPAPSATRVPSTPAEWPAPEPTNPELPVAGEAVWTTGDGSRVRVRFAVHAVRRTENATVLDWSVTPLPARGRPAGRPLPAVDLGLNRWLSGEQNLALLDVAGARAYRPLASVSPGQFSRCLCTPLFVAIPSLRFGETRLLQLSFPALPAGLDFVDVQLPNVASISHVPVTPAGSVPRALAPTDLARAGVTVWPATPGKTWTQPGRLARRETIRVDRVVAAPGLTSVEWTLRTVDDQTGFTQTLAGEPTARPIPDGVRVVNRSPASAPRIRVGSRELGTRWTTASFAGLPSYECLCSELDI